jgi:SAM-dependent methyltransferase
VTKRFEQGDVSFVRCLECGSWCQSPVVTEQTLARWIDSADYQGSGSKPGIAYANYQADEANRIVEARGRYAHDLDKLLRPQSKVLEVGCATGSLLAAIRDHGHEVLGVDLSEKFVASAKSLYGLDVRLGDVLRTELMPGSFDAVISIGTIGNFRSLGAILQKFKALLRPGGFVLLNFADADSLWVRLLYRDRFWMFTPSASVFLSARGCLAALRRAGFTEVIITNDMQQPSLRKLIHHAKVGFFLPALSALGIAEKPVPFRFPIPTVRLVLARPPVP